MTTPAPDWLFTCPEVAMALGISERQVRREVELGRLPCTLTMVSPGGRLRRRFASSDLSAYVSAYCRETEREIVLSRLRKRLAA
jgi:hypothetical protein